MNKNKKALIKPNQNYFLLYCITGALFLTFFLLSKIIFESHKIQNKIVYKRKLQINPMNGTSSNESSNNTSNTSYSDYYGNDNTDIKNKIEKNSDDFNPFYYLFGFYIIFILMSIYIIIIINRSKINSEIENKIKKNLFIFLFFANNGSLIVSLIFLSSVFRASGFLSFGIGLVVLVIGTFYYILKIKVSCNELLSDDNKNSKLKNYLINVPCTILRIVRFTYHCCRCEYYYDIETTTIYSDGTKEKSYCCTSILCLFWNIFWFVVKAVTTFFMIITYYIFFGIFLIFWMAARFIYSKCKKKDEKNKEDSKNDKNSQDTNNNGTINNNNLQDNNPNVNSDTSFDVNEKKDNTNHNNNETNYGLQENITNNINIAGLNNKNNILRNDANIFIGDKINNNINLEKNDIDYEKRVNSDTIGNKIQFYDYNNINNPA